MLLFCYWDAQLPVALGPSRLQDSVLAVTPPSELRCEFR